MDQNEKPWWRFVFRYLRRVGWAWYIILGVMLGETVLATIQARGTIIPDWILWAFGMVGLMVAGFKVWLTEYRNVLRLEELARPKLSIACGAHVPESRVETFLDIIEAPHVLRRVPCMYFRIILASAGIESVKNCCAYITKITKGAEPIMEIETLPLKFVHGDNNVESRKTIYKHIAAQLDVLRITNKNKVEITVPVGLPNSIDRLKLFAEPGTYLFAISIGSDNGPTINAALEFNWTGDWKTAELTLKK